MYPNTSVSRRRETVVTLTFTVLACAGLLLFLILLGGGLLLPMLLVAAVLAGLSSLHYLLWGQRLESRQPTRSRFSDAWAPGEDLSTLSPDHDRGVGPFPSPSPNGSEARAHKARK